MPPPPTTFERIDEIKKLSMNPAPGMVEIRIHKNFSNVINSIKSYRGGNFCPIVRVQYIGGIP